MNPNESNNLENQKVNDLYEKLVDLYAGHELSDELEQDLTEFAEGKPAVKQEMRTLRKTVDLLHTEEAPEFTEESYQRVLLKMYARGVDIQKQTPDPYHLQYQLPIQG
jgi:hypothetical protein